MQLFRSPLFQEAARPIGASYRDRGPGKRYGCRSVPNQHATSVTQEARIVAAREFIAEVAAARTALHYDQAA